MDPIRETLGRPEFGPGRRNTAHTDGRDIHIQEVFGIETLGTVSAFTRAEDVRYVSD